MVMTNWPSIPRDVVLRPQREGPGVGMFRHLTRSRDSLPRSKEASPPSDHASAHQPMRPDYVLAFFANSLSPCAPPAPRGASTLPVGTVLAKELEAICTTPIRMTTRHPNCRCTAIQVKGASRKSFATTAHHRLRHFEDIAATQLGADFWTHGRRVR
jgi:hypothetical protein